MILLIKMKVAYVQTFMIKNKLMIKQLLQRKLYKEPSFFPIRPVRSTFLQVWTHLISFFCLYFRLVLE